MTTKSPKTPTVTTTTLELANRLIQIITHKYPGEWELKFGYDKDTKNNSIHISWIEDKIVIYFIMETGRGHLTSYGKSKCAFPFSVNENNLIDLLTELLELLNKILK